MAALLWKYRLVLLDLACLQNGSSLIQVPTSIVRPDVFTKLMLGIGPSVFLISPPVTCIVEIRIIHKF